uniref:DNA-directed RNA polymerase RpoA/D/Rpb3-type domain-containing protein n=1 Tax=viral metagenome TaxID=1070528 RepID=A0A6C0ACG0_9ZZZZ
MIDTKKIKITQLLKREMEGFMSSRLILDIGGPGIDYSIVNGLRRVTIDEIPIYAYDSSTVDIEFNDSIYNNDMMELRLSNLPIFDIKNNIIFLSRKYYEKVDFTDPKRERHPDEKKIETYINVHNDTLTNMNITTDSIKMIIDGEEVKNPYKKTHPILLLKLRPNQAFKARLRAVLGIGDINNVYAGAGNVYYKEEDNRFKFTIESQGQMDEYELLDKGCSILIKKLSDVYENVSKNFKGDETDKNVQLDLINEDYTIGNLIKDSLQDHKDVIFAGCSKPDKQIKEVIIKYTTGVKNKMIPFKEAIDSKIKVLEEIQSQIQKLGSKYINTY